MIEDLVAALGPARAHAALEFLSTGCRRAVRRIDRASADASFRSYWRVDDGGSVTILMDAPPEKEALSAWVDVNLRLRDVNVHVPEILGMDLDQGFLLIEDFGRTSFLDVLDEHSVGGLYELARATLINVQSRVPTDGLPDYDETRLRAEMELFPEWFVGRHLGHELHGRERRRLESVFDTLIGSAREQPQVFVHRDYHARNLMLTETPPGVLDFQDAVRGPITYDLVSLLRDCYIAWEPAWVVDWAEAQREQSRAAGLTDADPGRWRRWFDWMGVQRHLKVLGIFARLYYRDGKPDYLRDLPLVRDYVLTVAGRYPQFDWLVGWLDRLTADVDLTRPGPGAGRAG